MSRLCLVLTAALLTSACDFKIPSLGRDPTVIIGNNAANIGPRAGHELKPTTEAIGHLRGFVLGQDGPKQPVRLAKVAVGDKATYAAAPSEIDVVEAEDDDGQIISVMHDFGDGKGAVLTERRPREYQDPDAEEGALEAKYAYLRPGEFLVEGVPAGSATLEVSFGEVGQELKVEVHGGKTVFDLQVTLVIPIEVVNEDGSPVK